MTGNKRPAFLSDEAGDVYDLLASREYPDNASRGLALVGYVRGKFGIPEFWVAERIAWWALGESVKAEEDGERRPLLAARHLLGFFEYPLNVKENFGHCAKSLQGHVPRIGFTGRRPNLKLTERQTIAAAEGGYGRRENLSGKSKSLPDVSKAVWGAMQVVLQRAPAAKIGELRSEARTADLPEWFIVTGDPESWNPVPELQPELVQKEAYAHGENSLTAMEELKDSDDSRVEMSAPDVQSEPPEDAPRRAIDDEAVGSQSQNVVYSTSSKTLRPALLHTRPTSDKGKKRKSAEKRPVSSPQEPIKPWLRVAVGVVCVVCVGGVIALFAASVAPHGLPEDKTSLSTEVETFLPSGDDLDRAQEISDAERTATCATRSFSSARADAFTCLISNVVHDPCFTAGENHVACPEVEGVSSNGERELPRVAVVSKKVPTEWLKSGEIVGVEKADLTDYPWAFELAYTNEEQIPYRCQVVPSSSDTFGSTIFSCSATEGLDGGQTVVTTWEDAFVSGKAFIVRQTQGVLTATDFQRTDPQWSVAMQLPGTSRLERVAITKAWF